MSSLQRREEYSPNETPLLVRGGSAVYLQQINAVDSREAQRVVVESSGQRLTGQEAEMLWSPCLLAAAVLV